MSMSLALPESKNPIHFFWTILIICTIIALWLVPVIPVLLQGNGSGSGVWGYFSIIALIITINAPLAYGWYSRDGTGAVLIGALPFLLLTGVSRIISNPGPISIDYRVYSIAFIVLLSLIGGLEGFFAAKKTTRFLLIALLLAGVWAGIFFSGIH